MKNFLYLILFNLLTQNIFGTITERFKEKGFGINNNEISTFINNANPKDKDIFLKIVDVYIKEKTPLIPDERKNIKNKAALNFIINYINTVGIDSSNIENILDTLIALYILDQTGKRYNRNNLLELLPTLENLKPEKKEVIKKTLEEEEKKTKEKLSELKKIERPTDKQKQTKQVLEQKIYFLKKNANLITTSSLVPFKAYASLSSWDKMALTLTGIATVVTVAGMIHYGLAGKTAQKAMENFESKVTFNSKKAYYKLTDDKEKYDKLIYEKAQYDALMSDDPKAIHEVTQDPDYLKAKEYVGKDAEWNSYKKSNPVNGFLFETFNNITMGYFDEMVTGRINLNEYQKEFLSLFYNE